MVRPFDFNNDTQKCIDRYLHSSHALAAFCSRDGAVDPQTLHIDVLSHHEGWVIVAVEFMEVTDQGDEQRSGIKPCFGRLELRVDPGKDEVLEAYVL